MLSTISYARPLSVRPAHVSRIDHLLGQLDGQSHGTIIGGDIGATNIRFAAVRLADGRLQSDIVHVKMEGCQSYDDLVRQMKAATQSIAQTLPEEPLMTVTGFPAAVSLDGRLNYKPTNITYPIDPDIGRDAGQMIVNDANAITTGVAHFDPEGITQNRIITILPGTGLGGAFYDGDGLFDPDTFELGHIKIKDIFDSEGPICGCKALGCAELWVSGPGLIRTAESLGEWEFTYQEPEQIIADFIDPTKTWDKSNPGYVVMKRVAQNTLQLLSSVDALHPASYFFGEGFLRGTTQVDKFIALIRHILERTESVVSFGRADAVSARLYPITLQNPGIIGAAVIGAQRLASL